MPHGWHDRRIVLQVEAVTHRAVVWVHQIEVMRHEGGYTPFEAQISEHVVAGASARITVVVDDTLNFQSVPPGVVEQTPDGPRQRYWHDFFNYAGLHRNVWLACTPTTYIDDITVTTGLSGRTGTVDYRIAVAGRPAVEAAGVRVVLRDADGGEVADGDGSSGALSVSDVHRWAPGDGYLYDLEATLVRDGDVQ